MSSKSRESSDTGSHRAGRISRVLATALLLGATALGCAGKSGERATTTTSDVGPPIAPDFAAVDESGTPFRLSEHRGQVVLITFFATWCVPCVKELPHLRQLYELHKDKGLLVVVISLEGVDGAAEVRSFSLRNNLQFPLILDDDLRITGLFNPKRSAPLTVLISRAGRILSVRDGYTPGDELVLGGEVADALGVTPPRTSAAPAADAVSPPAAGLAPVAPN